MSNRTRNESPVKRTNPSGKTVWIARHTDRDGKRASNGTYAARGPCKKPHDDGRCCAQHAIWAAYATQDAPRHTAGATVGGYHRSWLALHPRSDRTDAAYRSALRAVLDVELEDRALRDWPLADVRRKHVRLLLGVLLVDQGRAAKGARNILGVLSALYSDAIDDDECEHNPCLGVDVRASDPRVRKPPRERRVLSWEDMHRLAAAGQHEAMLRCCADCGLRLGELLGLGSEDVKLSGCRECSTVGPHLHVRRTAHDGFVRRGTKSGRLRGLSVEDDWRIVPVPAALAGLLGVLPPRIAGPMWCTPRGTAWPEKEFYEEVWGPSRAASGVESTPQDFRHSWVTHLRASGVDPADLAQMAGHSVLIASAVYTHALGRSYDDVRKAVGE